MNGFARPAGIVLGKGVSIDNITIIAKNVKEKFKINSTLNYVIILD